MTFLVSSGSAVDSNTQKVRKARKLKVKVVKADYLLDCKSSGKKLPLDEYIIVDDSAGEETEGKIQSNKSKSPDEKPKARKKARSTKDEEERD